VRERDRGVNVVEIGGLVVVNELGREEGKNPPITMSYWVIREPGIIRGNHDPVTYYRKRHSSETF
jgi:hypothetical protein